MGVKIQNAIPPTVMIFFNQTFSTYSLWQSSQNFLIGILKFNLKKKIEIFLTMGPYGSENFKTLLLLQFLFFLVKTFSECSL